MKKQILFVCGVKTGKKPLISWEKYYLKYFPDYDFNVVGNCKYVLSNRDLILNFKEEITQLINKYDKTILIGHSLGGIIIGSVKLPITKIEGILTLVSPHSNKKRKELVEIKQMLNYNSEFDKEIKSFSIGAYFDKTVPFIFTKTKFSKHKNIFAGHSKAFFFNEKRVEYFLKYLKKKL